MIEPRVTATEDFRAIIAYLVMCREIHNHNHPEAPIYHRDIAEHIGLHSKSTLIGYENGRSIPSPAIVVRWAAFWGYELHLTPAAGHPLPTETLTRIRVLCDAAIAAYDSAQDHDNHMLDRGAAALALRIKRAMDPQGATGT